VHATFLGAVVEDEDVVDTAADVVTGGVLVVVVTGATVVVMLGSAAPKQTYGSYESGTVTAPDTHVPWETTRPPTSQRAKLKLPPAQMSLAQSESLSVAPPGAMGTAGTLP